MLSSNPVFHDVPPVGWIPQKFQRNEIEFQVMQVEDVRRIERKLLQLLSIGKYPLVCEQAIYLRRCVDFDI